MPARISMTKKQRDALLALPESENEVVRNYTLDAADLATIAGSRTPETRLSQALQLCCLRYPGRHLRRGEILPPVMLDYIAEQIGADTEAIARFARRGATRYEQLAAIKQHQGYRDFTRPVRSVLSKWAEHEALGLTDGRVLLGRLIEKMRKERIVIPGITVVERLAASAMHAADGMMVTKVCSLLDEGHRHQLDALLVIKTHARQTKLSWLREPPSRYGARPLLDILDKIAIVGSTFDGIDALPPAFGPRLAKMAKEGLLYTSQAFLQMGPDRRHTVMIATLRELEITLTDGALSMFQSLVARANLRARKRLEGTIALTAEQGRVRLARIADVLEGFRCKLFADGLRVIGGRHFAGELFMFKGRHFDQSVILLCVRWYLAYGLSLRDLKEMMAERGISVDHSTIHRWVVHFSPRLLERFNRRKRAVTRKWHVDETYIKVRGRWMYLYRAIDSVGDTVEFWFSEHRDLQAAKRFFRKALERHGRPERVVIDGSQTNREAIASCDGENRLRDRSRHSSKPIRIRRSQYLNNRIEQDHRRIKRRIRSMLGFKSFASATATLAGVEMIHMMRKRQARYAYNPSPAIAEQFEIIAAA